LAIAQTATLQLPLAYWMAIPYGTAPLSQAVVLIDAPHF